MAKSVIANIKLKTENIFICVCSALFGCIHLSDLTVFPSGFVTGQFTAAPHTCSGDIFSFTCTVVGDVSGITTWRVNGSSECHLSHRSTSSSSICGPENDFTARSGTGFGTNDATSFTSSLSGTGSSTMDGILFECFGPDNNVNPENRVGSSTLQIIGRDVLFDTLLCSRTIGWGSGNCHYIVTMTTNCQGIVVTITKDSCSCCSSNKTVALISV